MKRLYLTKVANYLSRQNKEKRFLILLRYRKDSTLEFWELFRLKKF